MSLLKASLLAWVMYKWCTASIRLSSGHIYPASQCTPSQSNKLSLEHDCVLQRFSYPDCTGIEIYIFSKTVSICMQTRQQESNTHLLRKGIPFPYCNERNGFNRYVWRTESHFLWKIYELSSLFFVDILMWLSRNKTLSAHGVWICASFCFSEWGCAGLCRCQ